MSIYTLKTQMWTPTSVQETFRVFEDPANLARITPPWVRFKMLTAEPRMRLDAVFDYEYRWNGLPMRWRSLITDYEPPFLFVDLMVKGPYRFWRHKHTFHPTEQGTLVTDEVDYTLPMGWIGRMAHRVSIATQLKDVFRYRQMTLNEWLAGGNAKWTEPSITEKGLRTLVSEIANQETHKRAIL
ncbi:MAG: SRPBCC family protein [Acidobacteria bacterium]|nr:SRPBCC family protein [Acidobacteriota bacterium]